jgi:predicted phosphoadenosine phosphosulfate sulfurtransferase
MKIYSKQTVYDAALERMRLLFDEFDNVVVSFSGGKDSTVTLNLALIVAEEKGRLPLKVVFVDQEAEWQCVIDYIRTVMADPRVDPVWLQVPIKLFNATSHTESWLQCWEPGSEWMREKEPGAVTENTFGTDRFGEMFAAWMKATFGEERACMLAGVRTEESPTRYVALTEAITYKWITWGKKLHPTNHRHFTFYPLYDWSYVNI